MDRGVTYTGKGEFDNTLADYNQAIQMNPEDLAAYWVKGDIYSHIGEYNKAIAEYSKAINIDPNNDLSYRKLAVAYLETEEY